MRINREIRKVGIALLFLIGVGAYASTLIDGSGSLMLVVAAVFGGYMALNIGANDVANNVGPAVGSAALSLGGALVIAAIFEAMGALVAGGDVVETVKKGVINPALIGNSEIFVWLMMAALLAGAIWLNVATYVGAPVSTTHSIVGGVLGAGMAAAGFDIVNWGKMGAIVASWVISPVMGGLIAAFFLYVIKRTITYQSDVTEASKKVVPILISFMVWAFTTYLLLKGLKHLWKVGLPVAAGIAAIISVVVYNLVKPKIRNYADALPNEKRSVNKMFVYPLICSAALLSFAHGANDVANAVGPLAGIAEVLSTGAMSAKASIPLWVMMIGALGIAVGLGLFGPKLIKTVGSEITELDEIRAFCIAMAAAITVIIASQLGLPVSSTHIAVGGIFGVGFLREYLKSSYQRRIEEIRHYHQDKDAAATDAFILAFEEATLDEKKLMLVQLKDRHRDHSAEQPEQITNKERKKLKKAYKSELVKRSHLLKIAAAWVITVPASALLAAMLFFMLRGMLLP